MALTSRDETDLLLPLFSGAVEQAPFSSFLEQLRRRAGVISASITIRPGQGREGVVLFVGPDLRRRAHELQLEELNLADRIQYDRLRPGRVYSGDEFDDHDPVSKARRIRDMRKLGLADERVVRLLDEEAASAWLILASARPCTAADSALLSNLAPYAAAAVRAFVASERHKLALGLDDEGLQRAGSGWIVFDKAARVLALAPATARVLEQAFGHPPRLGERLRELGPVIERALSEAAAHFAQHPTAGERSLVLCREPHAEAILAPFAGIMPAIEMPAMVAYCRHTRPPADVRADHFARLFDLPRREAELAMLLADGHSLAEAGAAMGLTIETTRNYSKRLFAKTGVRGQAELVRAVYESCAVLAQDPP
jgi:DNA-binding CsgD family transcriptional regulator